MMQEEFYKQGLSKAKQKDYAGAVEAFTEAIALNPDAEVYRQRGLAYYDLGQLLPAVSDFTEAIKLNPQNADAYYCRAIARLALKNLPGALADVDKAININVKYAAAYNLRGIVKRKQGDINQAIANFKQAAELYLHQQDKENCSLCLSRIKQLQPQVKPVVSQSSPVKSIVSQGDYFTQLIEKAERGETNDAMEDLNWILQADSQDGKAYCCRGVVYYKQGKLLAAMSDFNQALRLNFLDAIVYRNRGKVRLQLGDNQGAIADFNQALQLLPQDALIYVARGNAYRATGHYLGAIEDYTAALEINPQNASAFYHRGQAHLVMEEIPPAMADFQRAASIFCEQEDWDNYQKVIADLKNISSNGGVDSPKSAYDSLRQRLLRLVGGQWAIAQRLIEQAKHYYPGMSEEWYLETVIHDLERDRGR